VGQNKKSLKETVAEIVADSEPMSPEPSHEADSKDASPNPPELPKHSALPERGSRPAQYRLEQQESGVKMMTSGRTGLIDRHATMGMFTDYAPPDQEPEPEEGMQRRHSGAKKQEEPDALKNMQFNRLMYTDYLEKIRPQVANTASTTINKVKAAKRAQRTREMAQTGTDVAMFSHRNMQARKPTEIKIPEGEPMAPKIRSTHIDLRKSAHQMLAASSQLPANTTTSNMSQKLGFFATRENRSISKKSTFVSVVENKPSSQQAGSFMPRVAMLGRTEVSSAAASKERRKPFRRQITPLAGPVRPKAPETKKKTEKTARGKQ
jgi:hypothetical protein